MRKGIQGSERHAFNQANGNWLLMPKITPEHIESSLPNLGTEQRSPIASTARPAGVSFANSR